MFWVPTKYVFLEKLEKYQNFSVGKKCLIWSCYVMFINVGNEGTDQSASSQSLIRAFAVYVIGNIFFI